MVTSQAAIVVYLKTSVTSNRLPINLDTDISVSTLFNRVSTQGESAYNLRKAAATLLTDVISGCQLNCPNCSLMLVTTYI